MCSEGKFFNQLPDFLVLNTTGSSAWHFVVDRDNHEAAFQAGEVDVGKTCDICLGVGIRGGDPSLQTIFKHHQVGGFRHQFKKGVHGCGWQRIGDHVIHPDRVHIRTLYHSPAVAVANSQILVPFAESTSGQVQCRKCHHLLVLFRYGAPDTRCRKQQLAWHCLILSGVLAPYARGFMVCSSLGQG